MISAKMAMKQTLIAQANLRKQEQDKLAKEKKKKIEAQLTLIDKEITEAISKAEVQIRHEYGECEDSIKHSVEEILTGTMYKYEVTSGDTYSVISWSHMNGKA